MDLLADASKSLGTLESDIAAYKSDQLMQRFSAVNTELKRDEIASQNNSVGTTTTPGYDNKVNTAIKTSQTKKENLDLQNETLDNSTNRPLKNR